MIKPTFTNDKSAPRMKKGQFSKQVIDKQMWIDFRKEYPEYKDFTDSELNNIWTDIAKTIREETVTNPLGVKLGSYTGELKLQFVQLKNGAMIRDDKISEEVGGKIPFPNIVTRKKVARIKWERRWAVKFNKILQFFAFDPTREINKMAKKHIDENPEGLRMARNTLGGMSVWRQFKNKK